MINLLIDRCQPESEVTSSRRVLSAQQKLKDSFHWGRKLEKLKQENVIFDWLKRLIDHQSSCWYIFCQPTNWLIDLLALHAPHQPVSCCSLLNCPPLVSQVDLSPPQMWPLPLLRLLFMNGEDALIDLWLGLEGWQDFSRHGDRRDTQTAGSAIFTQSRFATLNPLRIREDLIFLFSIQSSFC